jgi:hypothetical protein
VPLRRARILSKGAGWYESRGFRSVIELLDPGRYQRTVSRLHEIKVSALLDAMAKIDADVRRAIVDREAMSRMTVHVHKEKKEPDVLSPPPLKEVVGLLNQVSVAYEIILASSKRYTPNTTATTLGVLVDELIKKDCALAVQLIDALLPDEEEFRVLVVASDGKAAPAMPMADAWLYTWKLTKTFGSMTMKL